jgi:hypothetical protein
MLEIIKSTTITVDEIVYAVEQLSPNVKPLVLLMDDWRQKDADCASNLAMIRAALRDLQNNIVLTLRKERADATAAAAAAVQKVASPAPPSAETSISANDESAG